MPKLSTNFNKPIKIRENSLLEQIDRSRLKTNVDEINWSNDFHSDMFHFDCLFLTVDLKSFSHFAIDPINWQWDFVSYK